MIEKRKNEMDNCEMPYEVKKVLFVAQEKGVLDAFDLCSLGAKHGNNYKSLVNEIVEIAYASRHSDKTKHEAVVKAAEEVWKRLY